MTEKLVTRTIMDERSSGGSMFCCGCCFYLFYLWCTYQGFCSTLSERTQVKKLGICTERSSQIHQYLYNVYNSQLFTYWSNVCVLKFWASLRESIELQFKTGSFWLGNWSKSKNHNVFLQNSVKLCYICTVTKGNI